MRCRCVWNAWEVDVWKGCRRRNANEQPKEMETSFMRRPVCRQAPPVNSLRQMANSWRAGCCRPAGQQSTNCVQHDLLAAAKVHCPSQQ